MNGVPLIFLDTETTGLCPDIHAPWEIAWTTAIHYPDGRLVRTASFRACVQLSNAQVFSADDTALSIGRFTERYTSPLPTGEVISWLQADCHRVSHRAETEAKPHLVGAVPSFDHAMICQNWIGWPGFGEGLWHYHLIDVEALAAGKLGIDPPWNSAELTSALGVTIDEELKHTAAGDVAWAIDMYAAVYGLEVTQ